MAKMAFPHKALIKALMAAGVIGDPTNVARVVIDIRGGRSPEIYVRQYVPSNDQMQAVIDAVIGEMNPDSLIEPADAAPLMRPEGEE